MSPFLKFLLGLVLASWFDLNSAATTDPDWITEAVERHNEFRQGFSAPPLVLNMELCKMSQAWANKLAAVGGKVEHSPDLTYGENLFSVTGDDLQVYGSTPVDAWYDEIKHFNFQGLNSSTDVGIGSFTQMIWKSTKEMCISYATSQNAGEEHAVNVYVVAVYSPPGNVGVLEAANITPLLDSVHFYKDSSAAPVPRHLSDPVGTYLRDELELRARVYPFPIAVIEHSVHDHDSSEKEVDMCPKRIGETESTTDVAWIFGAISRINEYRKFHRAPALILSQQLCNISQAWSNEIAERDFLEESRNGCGENLYVADKWNIENPNEPIDIWYKEIDNYDFKHAVSKAGGPTGNFTQLLWKGSTHVCITKATTKDKGRTFVVANFFPSGNVLKKFDENVDNKSGAGTLKGLSLVTISMLAVVMIGF